LRHGDDFVGDLVNTSTTDISLFVVVLYMPSVLQITQSDVSRNELYEIFRKADDADMARRFQAMFLLLDGYSKDIVASIVGISKRELIRWIHAFNDGGIDGLYPYPKPGRPCRLTAEQKQELDKDLQRNPRDLGFDSAIWDGKMIKHHIEQKFDVHFEVRRVQAMMHELGFSLQRPRPVPAQADSVKQEAFKQDLAEKKRQSLNRTTCSCTWTKQA